MKFDLKNVITSYSDNKEKYIGWKGYFGNYLKFMEQDMASYESRFLCKTYGVLTDIKCNLNDCEFIKDNLTNYQFFYPIEKIQSEKKELEYRPYNYIKEMVEDRIDTSGENDADLEDDEDLYLYILNNPYWFIVKHKNKKVYHKITSVDFEDESVYMQGNGWMELKTLFENYKWITPFNYENNICGVRKIEN